MIESIYLKNWRSHKETFISFSKGTNLLIGRMGGGKTSVVDGICFSLFGTCPSLKQRKISIQDLIRNRPKEEDEAEVILKIKFNGESYEIKRTIRRNGKSHAEIRKNNHLIVSSPEQVTKYIEDLLEVDYDLFTRAIYTEQNRIDYFLNLPKGERKKEIDNLLGLSKFEKVRENVRKLVRRLMDRLEDREILLKSMDANKLIEEIKSFKSEKEKIEISLKELKEKREIVSKQFEEKKEKYNSEKKKKEKYDLLNTNLLAVENSIKILEKEVKEVSIEELKKMLYEENEGLKKLKEKMDKLKDETNKIIEEKNRIEKKVYEIEVKIEEAKEIEDNLNKIKEEISKGNINELEKEYEKILKEKEKVIEELSERKGNLKELRKAIDELKKEISKCPICDSELTKEKRKILLEKKEEEIENCEKEIKKCENLLIEKEKKEEEIKKLIDKIEIYKIKIDELEKRRNKIGKIDEKELKNYKLEIKTKEKEKEKLENEIKKESENYEKSIKNLENIKSKIEKFEKIREMKIEREKIIKEISLLNFNEKEFKVLEEEVKNIEMKNAELNYEIKEIESKLVVLEERIKDRMEELNRIENLKKECDKIKIEIEKFQMFHNAIVETQYILREELINAINVALEKIWSILYPYSDYPSLQLIPDEEENDYQLIFKTDRIIKVDGIASGGERALACLALRIALSMVLAPKLSWLILDEPTHNLDEEGIKSLNVVLHDHVPKLVEQIFLITHDENLKDAVSGKMIRFERDKNFSEISHVEEVAM